MAQQLTTERLVLRPFELRDAEPLAELLNDFEMAKWLTLVPFPYHLEDATAFISRVVESEPHTYAIEYDSRLIGCIRAGAELGYWIARNFHGQGFATEASVAAIDAYFEIGGSLLTSGYHEGNSASQAVQEKLGFRPVAIDSSFVWSRGDEVRTIKTELSRVDWEARG